MNCCFNYRNTRRFFHMTDRILEISFDGLGRPIGMIVHPGSCEVLGNCVKIVDCNGTMVVARRHVTAHTLNFGTGEELAYVI